MKKSRDAFRTISEVAQWLDIPTHVLRFWESRFSQIKPVKRAGGRRYYRPSDMLLIGGVKVLLHDEGMTIRGVQKLLREKGVKHVSSFSPELNDTGEDEDDVIEHETTQGAAPVFSSRAARETHAAVKEPEPQDSTRSGDEEEQQDMFAEAETAREDEKAPDDETAEAHSAPEAAQAAPAIPPTPNVPETDPADDDPDKADSPGVAARIALVPPAILAAHREVLLSARDRLKAVRARGAD